MAKSTPEVVVSTMTEKVAFVSQWANSHADIEVASSVSSMSFYVASHALYTEMGAKNAEEAYLAIEKEIVSTVAEAHTKSVVNRLKKINSICYDAYKLGLKIDGTLTTFQNLEDITGFANRITEATKDGSKITHVKGEIKKLVSRGVVLSALTKAINSTYREVCEASNPQVEQLTDAHYKVYNNVLSDKMSELKHSYLIEADLEKQFDRLLKMADDLHDRLSQDQIMAIIAKLQAPKKAVNVAEETDTEEVSA